MKAILEFDLDDQNDLELYNRANKAAEMAYVLWHLCNDVNVPAEVRTVACDWCDGNNINFEEIYT